MTQPLPDAATIDVLLEPRLLVHCPPAELNAAVPYDGWKDVDGLVRSTTMSTLGWRSPRYGGHAANAVISLGTDLLHYPALDIDVAAYVDQSTGSLHVMSENLGFLEWPGLGDVALIPSRHNQHAYGDRAMTWGEYADVITAMADAGCLGRGWSKLSLRRGFTLLRHPLHPKPHTPKETEEAW